MTNLEDGSGLFDNLGEIGIRAFLAREIRSCSEKNLSWPQPHQRLKMYLLGAHLPDHKLVRVSIQFSPTEPRLELFKETSPSWSNLILPSSSLSSSSFSRPDCSYCLLRDFIRHLQQALCQITTSRKGHSSLSIWISSSRAFSLPLFSRIHPFKSSDSNFINPSITFINLIKFFILLNSTFDESWISFTAFSKAFSFERSSQVFGSGIRFEKSYASKYCSSSNGWIL